MDKYDKLFNALTIESQSDCNLSCWFCPRTYDKSGIYINDDGQKVVKQMPTEKVISILDQACDLGFRGRVSTHHLSEPMLDDRLIEIALEIRKRDMKPIMNTNSVILRKEESLCKEVENVFDYVVIGIYHLIVKEEIEEEKQYWLSRLKGANVYFSIIPPKAPKEVGVDELEGAFPRMGVPFDNRMIREEKTFPNGVCHRPLERLLIKYNGDVCLCCEDYKADFNVGNVFQSTIKDLWFSKKRLDIVKNLIE